MGYGLWTTDTSAWDMWCMEYGKGSAMRTPAFYNLGGVRLLLVVFWAALVIPFCEKRYSIVLLDLFIHSLLQPACERQ
jgi:hypothetical protein